MRNRSRGRSAAKGTQLELRMRPRVLMRAGVVMRMTRHGCRDGGTQLQREWHAVRGHEAGRHVGSKQQQRQQQDASPRALPNFEKLSHASGRGGRPRYGPKFPEGRNDESDE
jgi:hypothetical protein